MINSRLTWICTGLVLVFAIAGLAAADESQWRTVFMGASGLALSAFALSLVRDALSCGVIRFHFSNISRAQAPKLFWACVLVTTACGVALAGTLIWALGDKGAL